MYVFFDFVGIYLFAIVDPFASHWGLRFHREPFQLTGHGSAMLDDVLEESEKGLESPKTSVTVQPGRMLEPGPGRKRDSILFGREWQQNTVKAG